LSQKQYALAVNLFIIAGEQNEAIKKLPPGMHADLDLSLNQKIGQALNQTGQSTNDQMCSLALIALACKYDIANSANFNKRLVGLYKDKPRSERSKIVSQYEILVTGETTKILLPDPVWEKVEGTYFEVIGDGLDKTSYVGDGVTLEKGWRTVAETKNGIKFEHYYGGNDNQYTGGFKLPVIKTFVIKKGLEFKIPKGEKLKFWAEKKIQVIEND
jgi:hypothetical protein